MDLSAELERLAAVGDGWADRAAAKRDLEVVFEAARWRRASAVTARARALATRWAAEEAAALRLARERVREGRGLPDLGADDLDALLPALLGPEPAPTREPAVGEIHLEATPSAIVLELLDRVPLGPADTFVDLGAGMGQIALLVRLLTGARAVGVEIEPAYVAAGRAALGDLGVDGVELVCADARAADLSAGTVFFLFAPFVGRMLEEALAHLRGQVGGRSVVVASYGPSTPIVARQPWLSGPAGPGEFELAVFRSR